MLCLLASNFLYAASGERNQTSPAAIDLALKFRPGRPNAYVIKGAVLGLLGEYEAARASLETAVAKARGRGRAITIHGVAWMLVVGVPELRDPDRAIELAQEAVTLAPGGRGPRIALGVARYRAGDWQGSYEALRVAGQLGQGATYELFFLAMVQWKLGDQEEARETYARAVAWMDTHRPTDEDLRCYRAEAEQLLRE